MLKRSTLIFLFALTVAVWHGDVRAATPAPVTIVTPAGGEFYIVGSKQRVRLDAKTRSKSIAIELSIDGGVTFSAYLGTIDNTAKDKSKRNLLEFNVPATPSGNCLLRATASGVASVSPGFSIGAAAAATGSGPVVAGQINSGASASGQVLAADGSGGAAFTPLDGKFVKVAGDTMTGALNVAGSIGISDATKAQFSLAGPAASYDFKSDSNGLRLDQSFGGGSNVLLTSNPTTGNVKLGTAAAIFLNGDNSVGINGALTLEANNFTQSVPANNTNCVFFCNTVNNSITITLPDPTTTPIGRFYIIKKTSANNSVTITPTAGTIDGSLSTTLLTNNLFRIIMCNGQNWFLIGQ
jgi:hypothetical protein